MVSSGHGLRGLSGSLQSQVSSGVSQKTDQQALGWVFYLLRAGRCFLVLFISESSGDYKLLAEEISHMKEFCVALVHVYMGHSDIRGTFSRRLL